MPTSIEVQVSGTPPTGTYNSSSNKVTSDGNISVNPGTTAITFSRPITCSWNFVTPYITFTDTSPFTITSTGESIIRIEDTDPGGGTDTQIEYTLHTSAGNFDPKIINKGTG